MPHVTGHIALITCAPSAGGIACGFCQDVGHNSTGCPIKKRLGLRVCVNTFQLVKTTTMMEMPAGVDKQDVKAIFTHLGIAQAVAAVRAVGHTPPISAARGTLLGDHAIHIEVFAATCLTEPVIDRASARGVFVTSLASLSEWCNAGASASRWLFVHHV
jgi:hypothetical protein